LIGATPVIVKWWKKTYIIFFFYRYLFRSWSKHG